MSDGTSLGERLLAWDGQRATAETLRAEVAAHPPIRLKGPPGPGERALAKAVDLYSSPNKSPSKLASWLNNPKNAGDIGVFRPLLGDPAMGDWPFADPWSLPESEARAWCSALQACPPLVDDDIRRFVRVLFQVRRRKTWLVAARTFATLALTDDVLRHQLRMLWHITYPGGLKKKWPKAHGDGLSEARAHLGREGAHLLRHTLFTASAFVAMGGELPGLGGAQLAAMALPGHDADRSVVVECLRVILEGHEAEAARPMLARRAKELRADVLTERAFLDVLAATPEPALRDQLIKPRWQKQSGVPFDELWEWLMTARWFQERGDTDALEQMRAAARDGALAFAFAIDGAWPDDPVDALITRLQRLLHPDRYAVTPKRLRAAVLAEARLLMGSPDIRGLDWPSLVRLTGETREVFAGRVEEVGEASLGVLLSKMKLTSRTMMREVALSPDAVLQIAHIQDGFIATQVAVHTERLLRMAGGDEERVRLLWRLLMADPPAKTFAELDLILRTDLLLPSSGEIEAPVTQRLFDSSSPLHQMVKAVSNLDDRRDADAHEIAGAFAALVIEARQLLEDDDVATNALVKLADSLQKAVAPDADVFQAAWLDHLERVVLGEGSEEGLVGWSHWLDRGTAPELLARRVKAEKALVRLRGAVELLREARPSVRISHFDDVRAASKAFRTALGRLGWPESRIVAALLSSLSERCKDALDEGRRSRTVVEQVHGMLERSDEPALDAVLNDPERLRLLPVAEVRRVHTFFLTHLDFKRARVLAAAQTDRVALPSPVGYMVPLYAAVGGGTFLVLDVGDAWLALVDEGAWFRYAITILITLGGSFGLLLNSLAAPRRVDEGEVAYWGRLSFRVMPTFLVSLIIAVITSALAMGTLGGFSKGAIALATLFLWSSLSLFLGVFVGLIVQGQSVTREN